MIKEIAPLLAEVNLSFTVSMKGDTISVTIVPKSKGNSNGDALLKVPLAMSGTAEEIEANFGKVVNDALSKAVGFMSNSDDFLKNAEEETKTGGSKKTTSKTETKEPAKKEEKPPVVKETKLPNTTAAKNAVKAYDSAMKRLETEKDSMVIEFLRKSVEKAFTDAKIDPDHIQEKMKAFDKASFKDTNAEGSAATEDDTAAAIEDDENVEDTGISEEAEQEDLVSNLPTENQETPAVDADDIF